MKLLAHRGYWNDTIAPNSYQSFIEAFSNGYGIETDFRDYEGQLVISHDPPTKNNYVSADDFFSLAAQYPTLPLAINIKADGLQQLVKNYLDKYTLTEYFVFDMSVPDMYRYATAGITYYTRQSELEPHPCLLEQAKGIWLDAFTSQWYSTTELATILATGKQIAIVSAELHKRNYKLQWQMIKELKDNTENLFLCTDLPNEAKQYFTI